MEENKKDCDCVPEQKKTSKRYLAFYIVGLFSVALVIILLSYLTQLQADRELANMNSALAEKDYNMQSVQDKMVALQQTVKEQSTQLSEKEQQLEAIRKALGVGEAEDLTAKAEQMEDERDAYTKLLELERAVDEKDKSAAKACIEYLEKNYGAGRLGGTAENAVFKDAFADRYIALKALYI